MAIDLDHLPSRTGAVSTSVRSTSETDETVDKRSLSMAFRRVPLLGFRPVHVSEVEDRLREMLAAAGVAGASKSSWGSAGPASAEDATTAWQVFERFLREPVDGEELDPDGGDVAASYSVVDWYQGDGSVFEVSVGRGFVFLFEGEYSHSAILRLTVQYAPTDELRALGSIEMFSEDGQPLDQFMAQALQCPGFQLDAEPTGIKVWFSEI